MAVRSLSIQGGEGLVMVACGVLPAIMALGSSSPQQGIERYLLQNKEPIVGVYYYPWFGGPPWRYVALRPAFEYNNRTDSEQIKWLLKTMTDYGVNLASLSYWFAPWHTKELFYPQVLKLTTEQAEKLLKEGRFVSISPYMEPPVIDKRFAHPEGIEKNIESICYYLKLTGFSPCFPELGGRKFTNIYVAYYRPTDQSQRFVEFLGARYKTVKALNSAWGANFHSFEEVRLGEIKPGTRPFADLQRFRAEELEQGWRETMQRIKKRTGFDTAFTGDCSNSNVGITSYMRGMTGLTWYSLAWEMNAPFARPKICSETAKYTGATFLYTIGPGYIDRQQPGRVPGTRIEHDPFLYQCSWANALFTLPEGIMLLTHTEWYEGSVIDYTREYGKRHMETTERYSTLFKFCFPGIYAEKRRKKPIAVVSNEWVTARLRPGEGGEVAHDLLGIVNVLQTLSPSFDVIPPDYLTEEELSGRAVVIVPCCGDRLGEDDRGRDLDRLLLDWTKGAPGRAVVVTLSRWWAERLGLQPADKPADFKAVRVGEALLADESENLSLRALPEGAEVLHEFDTGEPYAVSVPVGKGRVVLLNTQFGAEFRRLFERPLTYEWVNLSRLLEELLSHFMPLPRRTNSYEVTAIGPVSADDTNTAVAFAVNAIPWSYIVEHKPLGRDHSLESTKRWTMKKVEFEIPLLDSKAPVAEVLCLDSDDVFGNWEGRRFESISGFQVRDGKVIFNWRMKFHAVFCISQGPVKVNGFGLRVVPGQKGDFEIRVRNITESPVRGRLGMDALPGLKVEPVSLSLSPKEERVVRLPFEASSDYATGERTVVIWFDSAEVEGERTLFFRPLRSLVPPRVSCLTTTSFGQAKNEEEVKLILLNQGEVDAKEVKVRLGEAKGNVKGLSPGKPEEVTLRLKFPPEPGEIVGSNVEVEWTSPAGRGRATSSLRLVAVGEPDSKEVMVLAANPLLENPSPWAVIEVPVPDSLQGKSFAVVDEKGRETPMEVSDGNVRFVSSLGPGEVKAFKLEERPLPIEPASDLVASAHGLGTGEGLVMVGNSAANFVFDERFGGFLSWMAPRGDREGYAAIPGGALILEYDLGRGRKERLSERPGRLRLLRRGAARVELEAEVEDGFVKVVDKWSFLPGSPVALLERSVKVKRAAKFWDLSLALLRLDEEPFFIFWPSGVGGMKEGKKRGWLETWAIEEGYLAVGRLDGETAEAMCGPIAGLVVLTKEPIFRVRYGFFDGEAQIRLRTHKVYKGGETVEVRLGVICGKDLGWKWAKYLREALLNPPLLALWGGGKAFVRLRASQVPPPFIMPY